MAEQVENVRPQDPSKRNSPISTSAGEEPSGAGPTAAVCLWNGKEYTEGARVCDNHSLYEYRSWGWVYLGGC
jgi:hypothetical protein